MAPIRRYLRISKYSVLECRIYLDNPADAHRWLLNPRDPILPRVIESVRPLVLPKLREENEMSRGKGKGKKKKGVKDVVVEEDFEVSIFLTELSTRHSLLTKQKTFKDEGGRLKSNADKMTGTNDMPIEVQDDTAPVIMREESDEQEGTLDLADVPAVEDATTDEAETGRDRTDKRRRQSSDGPLVSGNAVDDDNVQTQQTPPSKPKRADAKNPTLGYRDDVGDDKKKLALNTSYEGFSIYGRILCLVVKRRGPVRGKQVAAGAGQAMMEGWIASTQVDRDEDD